MGKGKESQKIVSVSEHGRVRCAWTNSEHQKDSQGQNRLIAHVKEPEGGNLFKF